MSDKVTRVYHDTGGNNPNRYAAHVDITDRPCPAITNGIAGLNSYHFMIETFNKGERDMPKVLKEQSKPPYRVPLMTEIAVIPWNGFTVASTFSGCGGSCLGYRMAGFRVEWANEFVPAAQDSYRANAAPGSILDPRDIKLMEPGDVLKALKIKKGQLDLFDGSPPCQAFSTAGKRHKGWGEQKRYEGGHSQQNEDLFFQWLRLLKGLMPKTFVAENVSGLVKGVCKGYFLEILKEMKETGYRVTCKVLDAQWLGVPQQRQRAIFVGVRKDLELDPVHPKPLTYRYSVIDAIPWIGQAVHDESGQWSEGNITDRSAPTVRSGRTGTMYEMLPPSRLREGAYGVQDVKPSKPCPTVTISSPGNDLAISSATVSSERRKFTIAELRRICAFPDDFILTGSYAQQWERLGNSVPPVMMYWIAKTIRDDVLLKVGR